LEALLKGFIFFFLYGYNRFLSAVSSISGEHNLSPATESLSPNLDSVSPEVYLMSPDDQDNAR
jgi:hypothetical protein